MERVVHKPINRTTTIQPAASRSIQVTPEKQEASQQGFQSPYIMRFVDSGIPAQKDGPEVSSSCDFRGLPRAAIQPKLRVNTPGDAYEKEADRVAEQVMRTPEPQPPHTSSASKGLTGQAGAHEPLQTKGVEPNSADAMVAPSSVHEVIRSGGRPLDPPIRQFMEPRFGQDFSQVRVHSGARAAESARAVNAVAYTVGNNVVFDTGQYVPETDAGRRLLAHELAHTKQQREGDLINRTPGHEPNKDYSVGTITAKGKTIIKTADKKANLERDKHPVYFKERDAVTLVSSSSDMWVEVKGAAHYHDGKAEMSVADAQGWVSRRRTSMTLGLFEGLDIKDETATGAGGISTETAIGNVTNIVLHQTDSSTASGTLAHYKKEAAEEEGAQYLIGEDGKIHLVVPINERVGHVKGNRPVKVPEPKVADPTKVTDLEMKTTYGLIDKFYNELKTETIISKALRDYWANLTSQALYTTLKAHSWQLNPATSNTSAVGIEVVGRHKRLYGRESFSGNAEAKDYSSAVLATARTQIDKLVAAKKITEAKKNEVLRVAETNEIVASTDLTQYPDQKAKNAAIEKINEEVYYELKSSEWKVGKHTIYKSDEAPESYAAVSKQNKIEDFLQRVNKLNLSPELKAQLLKTEKRSSLEKELKDAKTTALRKAEIAKELAGLNKELYNFMARYDFMIYEDITGKQKYSLWLLVGKLTQHHKLDARRDVVGHEDVDKKIVGEGQNEAEFIRTMTAFTAKVRSLQKLSLTAEPAQKVQLRQKWGREFAIIESIDKGERGNETVQSFFDHFNEEIAAFNAR